MLKRRLIEVEEIVGDLPRRGAAAGLSAPLLEAAYTHLALDQDKVVRAGQALPPPS
jgi:ketopantoate reductase